MDEKKRIEVDLLALLKLAKDDKKMLIIWCIVFGIISIVYAFSIPRIYKSSVTLAPESSSGSNLTSGISSLASMVGVNLEMGGGYDAIYPEIYPDLMGSKDFQVSMFDTKVKSLKGDINTSYYDYLDTKQKVSWMLYPFNLIKGCASSILASGNDSIAPEKGKINPKKLTKRQFEVANDIGSNIQCTVDKKTNVIKSLNDRLYGRYAAEDIKSYQTGEILVKKNELIDALKAEAISDSVNAAKEEAKPAKAAKAAKAEEPAEEKPAKKAAAKKTKKEE